MISGFGHMPRRSLVMMIIVERDEETGEHIARAALGEQLEQRFEVAEFSSLGGCLDGVARATIEHPDYSRHERFRHGQQR